MRLDPLPSQNKKTAPRYPSSTEPPRSITGLFVSGCRRIRCFLLANAALDLAFGLSHCVSGGRH